MDDQPSLEERIPGITLHLPDKRLNSILTLTLIRVELTLHFHLLDFTFKKQSIQFQTFHIYSSSQDFRGERVSDCPGHSTNTAVLPDFFC